MSPASSAGRSSLQGSWLLSPPCDIRVSAHPPGDPPQLIGRIRARAAVVLWRVMNCEKSSPEARQGKMTRRIESGVRMSVLTNGFVFLSGQVADHTHTTTLLG